MSNYLPNEVVDILLILNECHRSYRRAARAVFNGILIAGIRLIGKTAILISQESIPSSFHQRQRNTLQNNNPRVFKILRLISIHVLVFVKQNVKLEFQELLFIDYYNRFDIILITQLLYRN